MDATGRLFRRWEMVDLALKTFVLVVLDHRRLFYWLATEGKGGEEGSRDFSVRHHRENTTEVGITGRPAVSF